MSSSLHSIAVSLIFAGLSAAPAWAQAPALPPLTNSGIYKVPTPAYPVPILPALAAPDDRSFYAERAVPHGRVEVVKYKTSAGGEKQMHVYLPPGYDTDTARRYPVLYLNHGGGENDGHWIVNGHADMILDNLIAEGKARPMIIVMPNTSGVVSGKAPKLGTNDACTQEYLKDMPFVDGHYRTWPNRDSRVIAGLSMGGGQTLNFGLGNLDTFAFSAAPNTKLPADLVPGPAAARAKLKLLYISAGNQDGLISISQRTHRYLKEHDVPHICNVDDHGHDAETWGSNFYHFAQLVFR